MRGQVLVLVQALVLLLWEQVQVQVQERVLEQLWALQQSRHHIQQLQ